MEEHLSQRICMLALETLVGHRRVCLHHGVVGDECREGRHGATGPATALTRASAGATLGKTQTLPPGAAGRSLRLVSTMLIVSLTLVSTMLIHNGRVPSGSGLSPRAAQVPRRTARSGAPTSMQSGNAYNAAHYANRVHPPCARHVPCFAWRQVSSIGAPRHQPPGTQRETR